MSPRSYSMETRDALAEETRFRILEAARRILADESEASLSMDAIARRADISRLTIYYQFKSRTGVLESLYDYLASRGDMRRMPEVFREPDPYRALEKLVRVFVGFWSSDRVVIRRLRALAALDTEISAGIHARDSRRHHIAGELLKRIAETGKKKSANSNTADVIAMLTGFETYDALAHAGNNDEEIVAILARLVRCAASQSARASHGKTAVTAASKFE